MPRGSSQTSAGTTSLSMELSVYVASKRRRLQRPMPHCRPRRSTPPTPRQGALMPMNPAVQAVIKAITRLQPDVANSWNSAQGWRTPPANSPLPTRAAASTRSPPQPTTATRFPLRVFTPLDIDFSLKRGLHVNEDHHAAPSCTCTAAAGPTATMEFYSDACMRTALKLERRVIAVDYRRSPSTASPTALEDCYAVARQLFAGTLIATPIPGASCSWATRPAATSRRP